MSHRCAALIGLVLFLTAGAVAAADDGFSAGLLFRVSGADAAGGYVFGTIHSDDPRVLPPPAVRDALEHSRRFVMEVLPDANAMLTSMVTMVFTDGRELRAVIGDDLYARSVAAVKKYGLQAAAIRQFKPWAVVTLLSSPPSKSAAILDVHLYQQAKQGGKELHGLETIQEQLQIFDDLSETDQIELLRDTLDALEQLPQMFERLLERYLRRDLEGLRRLSHEYLQTEDRDLGRRFEARAVATRNHLMAERLQPLLEQGGVFAAVGALHLPGPEGLLRLLAVRGYNIERIY